MARPTRAVRWAALWMGVTAAVWLVVGLLLAVRWGSIERPSVSSRTLFPNGVMRIGIDASFPPFAVATGDDLYGLDVDLGKAIGLRLQIPTQFVNMGYDGLYDSLLSEQVDVLISALPIDYSRSRDFRFTLPYFNAGLVLIRDADQPIEGMEDLGGRSVSFEFGSDGDLVARAWLRRIRAFETRPYETPDYALDAVRLGISDAALVDAVSGRLYLRAHREWDARYSSVNDVLYGVAVRADDRELWRAVNGIIRTMLEDGSLESIIARWF